MYSARVLADSVPFGKVAEELAKVNALFKHPDRLITVEWTFPRFILAEVNTHRVFSRNSASSRAIPPEDRKKAGRVIKGKISRVRENSFVPETFNKRVQGMGVGDEVDPEDAKRCKRIWLDARDAAIESAEALLEVGVDKSRINRLLEPFDWQTAIVTSSRWENFFALRNHPAAQPEFQIAVAHLLKAMQASWPVLLGPGEWHLPMVSLEEQEKIPHDLAAFQIYDHSGPFDPDLVLPRISAGRCAKVSYDTQDNYESPGASYKREVEKLENNGHLSPAEHPATPADESDPAHGQVPIGNFGDAWVQLRKMVPNEDNLIGALEGKLPWYEAEPVAAVPEEALV